VEGRSGKKRADEAGNINTFASSHPQDYWAVKIDILPFIIGQNGKLIRHQSLLHLDEFLLVRV
jgi:hypothetical protein